MVPDIGDALTATYDKASEPYRQPSGAFPTLRAVGLALFAAGVLVWGAGFVNAAWYRHFEIPGTVVAVTAILTAVMLAGVVQQWIRGHPGDGVQLTAISLSAPTAAMLALWAIFVMFGGFGVGIQVPTPTLLAVGDFCVFASAVLLWPGARVRASPQTAVGVSTIVLVSVLTIVLLLSLAATHWKPVRERAAADTERALPLPCRAL